ncbi:Major facilitator superfamily domain general substrate transporter [Penicillium concentricum]|uniref:Major facilitator superfamily domain general substrate transporter n=1 Tax=Penicillium concentricum TaxID=293559 RepID=A0A9W9SU46_9EURO|nr:Major facilitator superfamily domain general substrate transporter [Penicillium concentricum]KAJ5383849.1 Major facilitator superfamily domain general substrate transporter [Penicillium concentricum]
MPSHIKFAEPTSNKANKDRARGRNQEKGPAQRAPSPGSEIVYPTGWRLVLTTTGLLIGFFLSNLDVTIVSSALTSITDDLEGFEKRSWIITGYLATYTGSMAMWTKISDIVGRKQTTIASLVILLAFSIGCGCAHTVNQLIILRALQGIGGAGAYALTILCIYEIAPKTKLPTYSSLMSFCLVFASLIGPIIGGALAEGSAWRWTFLVNAPLCVIAIVAIIVAMPKNFGLDQHTPSFRTRASYRSFANLDIMGSLLMMAGSFLIVAVLNETNLAFSWSSRDAIALLVLTGLSWIAFFTWEWYISGIPGKDPIFPKRWLFDRPWIGILISSFVIGAPYNVVLVYVPQQAQLLLDKSPLDAGIYLIGYSAIAAIAAAIVNIASSRGRIPFIYTLLVGCTVHTVGIGLLSTIATSRGFHATDIGYLVIAGTGMGLTMGILVLSTPYIVEDRDLGMCSPGKLPDIKVAGTLTGPSLFVAAIATGTVVQLRFLGGAIGLAIASNILNGRLAQRLQGVMTSHELHLFLENVRTIKTLPAHLQADVKNVFASSFNTQLMVMIGFAAAQLPATLLLLKAGRQLAANKHSSTASG